MLESGLLGEAQGNYVLAGPLPPMAVPSIAAIGAFLLMRCEGENARWQAVEKRHLFTRNVTESHGEQTGIGAGTLFTFSTAC